MAGQQVVPVLDIESDNIQETWPTLILAVKTSTFVAVDTELSGLGNRKHLNAKSADDRYEALCNISRTRSVLSVGLSCFKLKSQEQKDENNETNSPSQKSGHGLKFLVQTFNILMLCSEEFVVEPLSLRFLTQHGFDFNRQYAKGISYYRGTERKDKERQWLRELFAEITLNKVPVVFHNAYVDLGFLYQSFHTNLPSNMMSFLADLTELFPGGIYDTKYITEFKAHLPASYLQYVFRKCQRNNDTGAKEGKKYIQVDTLSYPEQCSYVRKLPYSIFRHSAGHIDQVCQLYAAHGWCSAGNSCTKSHDIDLILDTEDHVATRKKNKRKRKKHKASHLEADIIVDNEGESTVENILAESELCAASPSPNTKTEEGVMEVDTVESMPPSETPTSENRTGGHRAGYDAFMTGFSFGHYISQYGKYKKLVHDMPLSDLGVEEFTNKVTLVGKDIPLHITKSTFAKTSKSHTERLQRLLKDQ